MQSNPSQGWLDDRSRKPFKGWRWDGVGVDEFAQRLDDGLQERERKADTRRKVILGGALMALSRKGDRAAVEVLGRIYLGLEPREKKPFKGWDWKGSE